MDRAGKILTCADKFGKTITIPEEQKVWNHQPRALHEEIRVRRPKRVWKKFFARAMARFPFESIQERDR